MDLIKFLFSSLHRLTVTWHLPAYTSDIIDVGIQDHGIEHILPKEITSEDYQMAQTFMLSDEKEKIYRLL